MCSTNMTFEFIQATFFLFSTLPINDVLILYFQDPNQIFFNMIYVSKIHCLFSDVFFVQQKILEFSDLC